MSPFKYWIYCSSSIFWLIIIPNNCCEYNWPDQLDITRNISNALVAIIKELFVHKEQRRMFNFQVQVQRREHLEFFNEILDETMNLLKDEIGIRLAVGVPIPVDEERHFSVLLVDSLSSLEFLYANISQYHLNIYGPFLIILQKSFCNNHYYDDLKDIMLLNWEYGITHADALVYAVKDLILLFHYIPYTIYQCKDLTPVVHNKFINGRWLINEFFISKDKHMYGCPLICATWEDLPYFKIENSEFIGIEGKLLEYLSAKMNFSIVMRWMDEEEQNLTIYDESAVFDKLFDNGTDFVVGAFHYKPTQLDDSFTPTSGYFMSSFYFIISAETDSYSPYEKLLLPFSTEIWIVFISMFLFGNVILFMVFFFDHQIMRIVVLGRDNESPFYNMIVISLGGPVIRDPKITFSRFLLMLWLLLTFVLRTVYQGLLYHYVRTDIHKAPPNDVASLVNHSDYRILMSEVVYNGISNLPILQGKSEVLNESEVQSFHMLSEPLPANSRKLSILTPFEYFSFFKYTNSKNYNFYVIPQKLFTQQLSIYMKKSSPFLPSFNLYISSFIYEGLMNRWERLLQYDGKSQMRSNSDDPPKPMKISNLYGALYILSVGIACSFTIFLIETVLDVLMKFLRRIRKWLRRRRRQRRRLIQRNIIVLRKT